MSLRNGIVLLLIVLSTSCASKKEIHYMQDADEYDKSKIDYQRILIQPNDILRITVGALIPETAIPYNRISPSTVQQNSVEVMKLEGYLVSTENTIDYPIIGTVLVDNMTTSDLEDHLQQVLQKDGHLIDPSVTVRILNAKVTILGEVNNPGTYSFTEESITLLQALGYAKDLTIRGKRDDVLVIREVGGVRKVGHLDLTSASWMDSPFHYIKPNDVIVINQNKPKVTSSGYIGDVGTILALSSVILSVIILVTK